MPSGARTPCLGKEAGDLEPVERLRGRNKIDAARRERGGLREGTEIADPRVWLGRGELRRAAVGADDQLEERREPHGGLAASRRAIPRGAAAGSRMRQRREQLRRVLGAERR